MSTHAITDYDLSTLDKVTHPTIGNLLRAQNQIAAILTDYPCEVHYATLVGLEEPKW